MTRNRFSVVVFLVLAICCLATGYIVTSAIMVDEPIVVEKAKHKISLAEAQQYQNNFNRAVEEGTLYFPHYGLRFDLTQMRELIEQEGGADFISAWGAGEDGLFVLIHYVIDKKGNVLSIILERGSCCAPALNQLQMARS